MQKEMRERMMATQLAGARDFTNYFGVGYSIALPALLAGAARTGNPGLVVPLVPLTLVFLYNLDFAYGLPFEIPFLGSREHKVARLARLADEILEKEPSLLRLPGAPLTVAALDARIEASKRAAASAAGCRVPSKKMA